MGGDEFVVLCDSTTTEEAMRTAHQILHSFREPFIVDGMVVRATASVGIATAGQGSSPKELLKRADASMYRAKRAGRNQLSD